MKQTRTQNSDGGLLPKAGVLALLLGFSLGASPVQAADQPQYRFTEITLPGPGWALGINDGGLVTGGYYTDSGGFDSFVIQRGELTTGISGPDGATFTSFGPANNRGLAIGNYGDDTEQQAAFYDVRTGVVTTLPEIPNMPLNFGDGINDFGHVSGVAYTGGTFETGTGLSLNWIWDGRDYDFFTVPGAVNGAAAGGINNRDQVAGYYVDAAGSLHGFLKDGPKFITLDPPGSVRTLAFGINNLGAVAGRYVDASGGHHGFVWFKGTFVTVDADIPGSLGTTWIGINDHGDLAGLIYLTSEHIQHAVIAIRVDGDGDRDDRK